MSYDTEFSAELATEGKAAVNDDDAPPLHYLLKYDDGDQEHVSWSTIQIGIRNLVSGGFIELAHLHETRHDTFLHGSDDALEFHTLRTTELEAEYLRRTPDRVVDARRTRIGSRELSGQEPVGGEDE